MCGINGFNFLNRKLIKEMNESLKHRGPDGEGVFNDKEVSLGHRRLSIIDLSKKGAQPMTYIHKKRKAIIVFNGEIYNFQEIKEELLNKGYKFKSKTDTEVILASYIEWGPNCVNKFNGMWAFCIYDLNKRVLFLSRDRVGKKPLHYFFDGKKFIFSSEIKSILKHQISPTIDKESVDFYLSLGYIPAPKTIYSQISKLEARQNILLDLSKKELKKYYYYDWPNYRPLKDKQQLINKGKELLSDSVKKRLISDVHLGAFLSGGLDSSTIICKMNQEMVKDKLNTYSIGFEGEFDESRYIKIITSKFSTIHHHKYFTEDDFKDILKDCFYYYDEPFADPSLFPNLFLTKFTKEGLTVSLSGDGGDEVFGGYPRYNVASQLDLLRNIPAAIRKIIKPLCFGKIAQGIDLSLKDKSSFYEARSDFYRPKQVNEKLKNTLSFCLKKTNDNLQEAVRLMDIYLYTLPENFLQKVDRASMANGLEVRCPFLDYRLIEYSMQIPTKWKCGIRKNKILMKEIIKEKIPEAILTRAKVGFTPPINKWISKQEYKVEINKGLDLLEGKGIIDANWKQFYEDKIMKERNLISNNYKIRLFLLYKWYQYWNSKYAL